MLTLNHQNNNIYFFLVNTVSPGYDAASDKYVKENLLNNLTAIITKIY